jgi:hypothetical protein
MTSRFTIRFFQTIILCVAVSGTALAQYGGGMGGTGNGTYTAPKGGYGAGKAVGIGVGVAATVAGIALYVHHRHQATPEQASLVGCTQSATHGLSVINEKDRKTYSLLADGAELKSDERVELRGQKIKDSSGNPTFRVQNIVQDYGACVGAAVVKAASASR